MNKKLQERHQRVSVSETLNHDMERLVRQPVSSAQDHWIKLCAAVSHVGRFQDVATLSINQESTLIDVHVWAACLEV